MSDWMDRAREEMLSAAAGWDARLRSPACTETDRRAFAAWCAEDPAHAELFDRLQAGVRNLHAAAAADPQLRAIRDRAQASAGQRGRRSLIAASLVGAILIGAGGYVACRQYQPWTAPSVYRTTAGERTTIRLADGSVVMLNTKTELRVAYRRQQRALTLVAGEAVFDVAKDPSRPFVVMAGRRQVAAVGTAFDVRLDPDHLRVTMMEGKVKIGPVGKWAVAPREQFLVAGQKMVAGNNALEVEIGAADLSKDTAWRQDRLIFEGETLAMAVEEVNRYTDKSIRIGDASLNNLSISGMFRTTQPEKFVTALTSYYPVRAQSSARGETVLLRTRK